MIDLVQPARPATIARFPMSSAPVTIKVSGEFAYVGVEGAGLQVLDLAEPTRPELVGNYPAGWHPYNLTVDKAYVYVLDAAEGLIILKSRPATELFVHTQRETNGGLKLSWPQGFGGILQTATNLDPTSWADFEVSARQNQLHVSPTNQTVFYRLRLP